MTDIRETSNLNCTRDETPDFGNCESCNKTLEIPFYQNYHNEYNGEYCKSGPITSEDQQGRYDFLGLCKMGMNGEFEEMRYVKKETLCLGCFKDNETKVNALQLHLKPDSINEALEDYRSTLPDLSGLPTVTLEDGLDEKYDSITEDLDIAFAEEDTEFDKDAQERLDNLVNNFIRDKGRRYPNNEELARWLRVSNCKIFDMRGLNYIRFDVLRRFVVFVHFPDLWWDFELPLKVIWRRPSPIY